MSHHFRTISKFGFPGIEASAIKIKLNCQVESLRPDKNGYVDITQIIYHTIRVNQTIIGDYKQNRFYLPQSLIRGLIAAINEYTTEV